jgi:GTP cyclohydrolase I
MAMRDIQNQKDNRNIDIQKVGVKGIKYPIVVLDRMNGTQHVNATINIYVDLPHHFKGTHMSRFVEILNEFRGQINIKTFHKILHVLIQRTKHRQHDRFSRGSSRTGHYGMSLFKGNQQSWRS